MTTSNKFKKLSVEYWVWSITTVIWAILFALKGHTIDGLLGALLIIGYIECRKEYNDNTTKDHTEKLP